MRANKGIVWQYIEHFIGAAKVLPKTSCSTTLGELRNSPELWTSWEAYPGLFFLLGNNQLQYIGRAFSYGGLGTRLRPLHLIPVSPEWDRLVQNPSTEIGIVAFQQEDWHWVPSLELFLIARLGQPYFNRSKTNSSL
ncbi:hypothetical protein [Paenibacillus turpanensis]|uniref:hypothetical protein n=1 Tax=Paenibacillus turpanensis TaxID=2689078 RepID=UPI00140E59CF|nr:hypothetical protein [Paenibacillus turpanensis]